jgi:hypothetical protein
MQADPQLSHDLQRDLEGDAAFGTILRSGALQRVARAVIYGALALSLALLQARSPAEAGAIAAVVTVIALVRRATILAEAVLACLIVGAFFPELAALLRVAPAHR